MAKPKIGLITYCAGNQGSTLQCYATQKYLLEKGVDCCLFIRRESGVARVLQSLEYRLGAYLKLLKFPQSWPIYKECRHPQNSYNAMTQETANIINDFINESICVEEGSWRHLRALGKSDEYMAFFSGSDQIWSGTWFITNKIWFLRFCPKHKRVAWAPSFGTDIIADYNKDIYRHYISEYKFLSVRESSGQRIIQEMTGKKVPVLPDPVYLLSADEWRTISADIGTVQKSKYILMFFISKPTPHAVEYAQKKTIQYNAKIIWLSYDHGLEGTFVNGGPREFIAYIDNAALVLTDSFHACLFSIILSSPFYVYKRSDVNGGMQVGRIQNLLGKFKMQDRMIEDIPTTLSNAWDLDQIRKVLCEEKSIMDEYLNRIIDYYVRGAK